MLRTDKVLSMPPPFLFEQVVNRQARFEQVPRVRRLVHGFEYCGEQHCQLTMRNGVEVFRFDLLDCQRVQIPDIAYQPRLKQQLDRLVPQPLDIHRGA